MRCKIFKTALTLSLLLGGGSAFGALPSLVGDTTLFERGVDKKWKGVPEKAKSRLKLFLLIGDSEMDGRGEIRKDLGDLTPHPRVININPSRGWENTIEPVHTDSDRSGQGPSLPFARAYADMHPDIYVGMVCIARSGSAFSAWSGTAKTRDNWKRLFDPKTGILPFVSQQFTPQWEGVIVLCRPGYSQGIKALADSVRLWLGNPKLPVVIAEQAPFLMAYGGAEFNTALQNAANTVPYLGRIPVGDLKSLFEAKEKSVVPGEPIDLWPWRDHFCRAGNDSLGVRFAWALTKLKGGAGGTLNIAYRHEPSADSAAAVRRIRFTGSGGRSRGFFLWVIRLSADGGHRTPIHYPGPGHELAPGYQARLGQVPQYRLGPGYSAPSIGLDPKGWKGETWKGMSLVRVGQGLRIVSPAAGAWLEVVDMQGRTVHRSPVKAGVQVVPIPALPKGLYRCTLGAGKVRVTLPMAWLAH